MHSVCFGGGIFANATGGIHNHGWLEFASPGPDRSGRSPCGPRAGCAPSLHLPGDSLGREPAPSQQPDAPWRSTRRSPPPTLRGATSARDAIRALAGWSSHPLARYFTPYLLAAMNGQGEALEAIEASVRGTPAVPFLHDPAFDVLRDDPRFVRLAERFRLESAARGRGS